METVFDKRLFLLTQALLAKALWVNEKSAIFGLAAITAKSTFVLIKVNNNENTRGNELCSCRRSN